MAGGCWHYPRPSPAWSHLLPFPLCPAQLALWVAAGTLGCSRLAEELSPGWGAERAEQGIQHPPALRGVSVVTPGTVTALVTSLHHPEISSPNLALWLIISSSVSEMGIGVHLNMYKIGLTGFFNTFTKSCMNS